MYISKKLFNFFYWRLKAEEEVGVRSISKLLRDLEEKYDKDIYDYFDFEEFLGKVVGKEKLKRIREEDEKRHTDMLGCG